MSTVLQYWYFYYDDFYSEGGGTNISKGLELGYAQAKAKTIPEDAVRVVLLLSDGRANAGLLGTSTISKLALDAFQDGIQTSAFGLGEDYDGELMSAIASEAGDSGGIGFALWALLSFVLTIVGIFWIQGALVEAVRDVRDGRIDVSIGAGL